MMKRGIKRGSFSDSVPDSSDPSLQGKKIMAADPSDVHRAESSHQYLMAEPLLDAQRAASAHKHVRALNTQFASWVQSQLQDHPDELWENGVRDYLAHASSIMEKFSDVVNWIKAHDMKGKSVQTAGFPANQKNLLPEAESNKPKMQLQIGSGFVQGSTPSSIPPSWTSTALPSNQNLFFGGNQSSTPAKVEASADSDGESNLEAPSSPSVKKTEEEGIVVAHEVKCKVYVKPDNPAEKGWKDMGMGMLSIKCKEGAGKGTKGSKPTVIIRNDVGKILLNALIYPGIKMNIQKNTIASIFHTSGGGDANGDSGSNVAAVARTYLLRMKNEEETKKLAATIEEHAPTA